MTNETGYDEHLDNYGDPGAISYGEESQHNQEAEMATDAGITIIGKMEENKMAKGPTGTVTIVSERTLNAIKKLGIPVTDNPDEYKF